MTTINGDDKDNTLTGTAGADLIDGGLGADAMSGLGGNDVYIVENAKDTVTEMTAGAAGGIDLVKSSVDFFLGANVENLTLTGAADIEGAGNALNNIITGNDGANELDGAAGADTMIGGKGDDVYDVENAGDKVVETVSNANGGGYDTVVSEIAFSLAAQVNIEGLILHDGAGDAAVIGNALDNYLVGNSHNNIVNGGKGADTMAGGTGDDTYMVDNAADKVWEFVKSGTDTVISTVALTNAFAEVENYTFNTAAAVTFTGNAATQIVHGGSGKDTIDGSAGSSGVSLFGNAGDDALTGGSQADLLDGGAGADTMKGGDGSDHYVVDNAKDIVVEMPGGTGIDLVSATISIAQLADNVENAELLGAANLNLTGNDLDNTLTGNAGANIIDGGKGTDAMAGGAGNDTYIVDNLGDTVSENAGGGVDTVKSAIDYSLGAELENLTLTGVADVDATGNALDNLLTGNDGNNHLDGGSGKDSMTGGKGDDTYFIDNAGDKVVETLSAAQGGGYDTVVSNLDFSLANLAFVEQLDLLNGAVHGTGNALDNYIYGNNQNNDIDGGKGADVMLGGLGGDTYYVDNVMDMVGENFNEGTDVVISTVALTKAFADVENYTFNTAAAVDFTGNAVTQGVYGGSGKDTIDGSAGLIGVALFGNAGDDSLIGGSHSDLLNGGSGADTMKGGDGADSYSVDNLKDVVEEMVGGQGTDLVYSSISIANLWHDVEKVSLLGAGNLNVTGNGLDNILSGNTGANILDGGKGADLMAGYGGNDTYVVDNIGDIVGEGANAGIDLVKSAIGYALGANVENLTLTGNAAINGIGNALDNIITGNDGANQLSGGLGKDAMTGGKGDDTYYVDDAGDKVVETLSAANGGGHDTVSSALDFSLAALGFVEDLYLTGAALKGTGNALANLLNGNDQNNVLDGGAGADHMAGGKGDDTYFVDDLYDKIDESLGQGTHDAVISTIALSQGFAYVEDYIFNTASAVHFTGDAGDNRITGGSGNDVLDSGGSVNGDALYGQAGNDLLSGSNQGDVLVGGTGVDTMQGFGGDDTYYVDNVKDDIQEDKNGGNDLVFSTASVLKLWGFVENLILADSIGGVGKPINATGNDLDNLIQGNTGNNVIDGAGGADKLYGGRGDDTLTGGAGVDTFQFNKGAVLSGHDVITDFSKSEDKLDFVVGDVNHDSKFDINDLLDSIGSVVDHGAGKAVDVHFVNGDSISFTGVGTGAVTSITDLVQDVATQIHVQ